jgi:hypothetical protein
MPLEADPPNSRKPPVPFTLEDGQDRAAMASGASLLLMRLAAGQVPLPAAISLARWRHSSHPVGRACYRAQRHGGDGAMVRARQP